MSIHGYNWWDNNVGIYIQGLLRYCYENTPVVLEEFEYKTTTINETINSASGWLAWASYQGPFDPDPEAFLFDINENITNSGKDFQQKALSIKNQIPIRTEDESTIDVDLKTLLTNTESLDSLYNHYVEIQNNLAGPLGFNIINYHPPASVLEDPNQLPTFFDLMQNYPNPFNPTTTIKYSTNELSNVTLKVFDVLGRQIITLVNKEQPQGNYEIEFDATELTSGIYYYRIQAGDPSTSSGQSFVETKKMILLR